MDKQKFEEYLETRYKDQMFYYSHVANLLRRKYTKYRWTLIILASVTPVLAALNGRHYQIGGKPLVIDVEILVIITSAIVAILTTALKTFQYEEKADLYGETYQKLRNEFYYYEAGLGKYEGEGGDHGSKEVRFIGSIEDILNQNFSAVMSLKKPSGMEKKE